MATTHVFRRGGTWWFVRGMPRDLHARFGSSHVRRSLRTADHRLARRRAARMTVAMDDWETAVRKAMEDDPEQPDRALLSRMLDEAMELANGEASLGRTRQRLVELRSTLEELTASQEVGRAIRETLQRTVPIIGSIKEKVARLHDLKAKNASSDDLAAVRRELAEHRLEVRSALRDAHKERWSPALLSETLPEYLEDKAKTLKNSKHLSTLHPKITLFIRTVGDKPVRDYE